LWFRFGLGTGVENQIEGNGFDGNRLLHEAVEKFAAVSGTPPVESESELVQVVIEVLVTDGSLMGSH